eukprot:g9385.t1
MSSVDGVRARIVLANASMEWGAASASRIMGVSRGKARYWETKALDPDFHPGRHGGRTYSILPRPDQIALEWACYFMWRSEPGLTDAAVVQHLWDLGWTWSKAEEVPGRSENIRTPPVLSIWMKAISKTGIAHVGSGVEGKGIMQKFMARRNVENEFMPCELVFQNVKRSLTSVKLLLHPFPDHLDPACYCAPPAGEAQLLYIQMNPLCRKF